MNNSLITHQSLQILYGDQETAFPKNCPKNYETAQLLTERPFAYFAQSLNLHGLVMLNQVHSTQGLVIKSSEQAASIHPSSIVGDFMVTSIPGIGLGVETADCLALTLYDAKNNALGIAHAGWRGSVANIAGAMLNAFYNNYKSSPEDIYAYLSPAARACCYEVTQNVLDEVHKYNFLDKYPEKSIIKRDTKYFFDKPLFNKILLQEAGIPEKNIDLSKSLCTIHLQNYCSYRRDGQKALRHLTCAVLKC